MGPRFARLALAASLASLLAGGVARADDPCKASYEGAQEGMLDKKLVRAAADLRLCRAQCPTLFASECEKWLKDLAPRVPHLDLHLREEGGGEVSDATVEIDGRPAPPGKGPVELDPGKHEIVARRGARTQRASVALEEGELRKLEMTFPRPPPKETEKAKPPSGPVAADEPDRWPWIVLGAGLLTLAGAGALTFWGHITHADYARTAWPDEPSALAARERIQNAWIAAGALGAAGGVLVGFGAYGLLRGSSDKAHVSAGVSLGPGAGALSIKGSF
jgi:hypothetical protein